MDNNVFQHHHSDINDRPESSLGLEARSYHVITVTFLSAAKRRLITAVCDSLNKDNREILLQKLF